MTTTITDIAPGDTIEVLGGDLKGCQFTVLTATQDGRISFDLDGHRAWARQDAYRKVAANEPTDHVMDSSIHGQLVAAISEYGGRQYRAGAALTHSPAVQTEARALVDAARAEVQRLLALVASQATDA